MNRHWYSLAFAIILIGVPFHQPLLLVIGLLVLLVVGTTDIWATYSLRNIQYRRGFSENRALFGEQITMSISLENAKLLPLPWVEIEDTMPDALTLKGQRLRTSIRSNAMVIEMLLSLRWYERVTRRYTVICNARGVHGFGPTIVRSSDLFGFLNQEESIPNWQYVLVYPLVLPLTSFGLPARHPFGDRRTPHRLLEDPSRVIGIRDYVYGDSLRRVHWKATARTMQLQSKVYEATTTYTLVMFLNIVTHLDSWYGINSDLQELSICAAASVADWAIDEGYAVGLYANTILYVPEVGVNYSNEQTRPSDSSSIASPPGQQNEEEQRIAAMLAMQLKRRRIHLPPASTEEQRKRIMEVLARIQPYFGSTIEDVIQAERTHLPAGSTVVVITSTISDRLLDTLARIRQSGHTVTLLFVSNSSLPARMAGITIHHLGGAERWQEILTAYNSRPPEEEVPTGQVVVSSGFQL